MKIHDLEVFCAVAEEESFVKAARRLYVSQSAVTQLIRKIETELGFPLLLRNKHFVKITSQGRIFYSAAKDILNRYWQALEDCSREPGAKQTLRVFYVGPSGAPYLTGALKRFHSLYSDCNIVTQRLRPNQVCSVLERNETNLVFTPYELIADNSQISFYPLYQDCHYCIMEAGNPLRLKKRILLEELAGKHILLPPRAFHPAFIPEHIQPVMNILRREEMRCQLEEASNIDNALIQILSHNDVIAIVPGFCIPEHPRLHATPLEDKVQIQMGLAHCRAMSRVEEAFALLAYEVANSYQWSTDSAE